MSVKQLLERGLFLQRRGNIEHAFQAYQQILKVEPNNFDAKHYMGVCLFQAQKLDQALQCFNAIKKHPSVSAEYFNNYALALSANQAHEEALLTLKKGLKKDRKNPRTFNLLGSTYKALQQFGKAKEAYKKAITLNPKAAELYYNLAELYRLSLDVENALTSYQKAISLNPKLAVAYFNQAIFLIEQKRCEDAIELLLESPAEIIKSFNAQLLLARAYSEAKDDENALKVYSSLLERGQNKEDILSNMMGVYLDRGAPEEALSLYENHMSDEFKSGMLGVRLALTYKELGDLDKALAVNEKVIAIDGDTTSLAKFNASFIHLLKGDFEKGWPLYESRKNVPGMFRHKVFAQKPLWDGTPLGERRLLVYWEQGMGDSLLMSRYLARIKKEQGQITLQCQAPLKRLFDDIPYLDKVVVKDEDVGDFDCQVSFMSLPYILGETFDKITSCEPSLQSKTSGEKESGKLRVGLCWQGANGNSRNHFRSLEFSDLTPLFDLKGVEFVNLQVSEDQKQIQDQLAPFDIPDPASQFKDFYDTKREMEQLDIILTVDTSVAHLSGVLGLETWVMLGHRADWRYFEGIESNPFYPNMTVFRQPAFHDWKSVVDVVKRKLQERS